MRWVRILVLGGFLFSLTGVAFAYKYWERKELADDLEIEVGEKVRVVDEVLSVHPKKQSISGYFKFDTVYFRCLIPNDKTEAIEFVKSTSAKRTKGSRRTKRLLTIDGTVEQKEVYGTVGGKDAGVRSEAIFLVVDKVSRPRARYFKEIK